METSYLANFLLVVETGSLAEAARRLNLTAAAIAQQIRTLEKEFQAPLLARSGRTVQPTPAGHRLAQSAPQLLRELADTKTYVNESGAVGELRVGTINTALHSLLPESLSRFIECCPQAKVFLESGTTQQLYQAVQQGSLDAAVCLHPPFALSKAFGWAQLREEPLVLLAPQALAHLPPHELLSTQPLIRYDRTLGGGQMVEDYLRQAGIAPQERFELSSLVAIAMMVEKGLGVALVPDTALSWPDGKNVVRLALPLTQPQARRFGIIWLRASARLPLIQHFAECARSVASDYAYQQRRA